MTLEIGSPAPGFTLSDQHRNRVSGAELWRGQNVLLVFYPFAFSSICQGELCRVRDEISAYRAEQVQVVGVSVDTPFALAAWAEQQDYDFPLLSDFWPHGEVARAYGVLDEEAGMAVRGTFLIDSAGIVRFGEVVGARETRDQEGWRKAVAALNG